MTIQNLKMQLNILEIGRELGIEIDKNGKAKCPFHNDKTPSLQFSEEKQKATCFSSNCDAGSMDVLDLVQKYKGVSLSEAREYLESRVNGWSPKMKQESISSESLLPLFKQFKQNLSRSPRAFDYLADRGIEKAEVGYNAKAYPKLNNCLVFPLKNKENEIVSFYGRSILNNETAKHFYLKNRTGLYPFYPSQASKRIILTEAIIDCATLMQIEELKEAYSFLSLYGTNGLTAEHLTALQQIEKLEEITLFFDGDEAGKEALYKQSEYLTEMFPGTKIRKVTTPENEDVNSIYLKYGKETILELLESKEANEEKQELANETPLNTSNPNNIQLITETAIYSIKGGLKKDLDSMRVSLQAENKDKRKSRNKLDLYEDKQVEKTSREIAEKLDLRADLVEQDLCYLTDLLEEYRESKASTDEKQEEQKHVVISEEDKRKCIAFLQKPNLLKNFNELIGKSGVVSEEKNRLFLFGIGVSHKFAEPLHALIQGSSGSGKTHLMHGVLDLLPQEKIKRLTRITESSFYNFGELELVNTLIAIEDLDGLKEDSELAFRELQSNGELSSSVSAKDSDYGEFRTQVRRVRGPIGSFAATTAGEIYEDNMSRCFLIAVDESDEQTTRILQYQNQVAAGIINNSKQKEIQEFVRNCIRLLKPQEVINPFATELTLPKEAHKIRRLNGLLISYIKVIAQINQYQRTRSKTGALIATKEDVKTAIEIMFDSIILKIDELDGSLRLFYEKLKSYINKFGSDYEFTQREIRLEFRISKSQLQRYFSSLTELEYIVRTGIGQRGVFSYKIAYWDNQEALRNRIKEYLDNQLEKL